ncbi:hypothetical protein [Nannocystis pusilla]|uniref:hypothetical protein n=1 Tax=Nannocystis pusilla TaxID=889268 RepID=UPI003B7DDD58
MRSEEFFYVDCGAEVDSYELLGVAATASDGRERVLLRVERRKDGAGWHAHAGLRPGRWTIVCSVFDRAGDRPLRLSPAELEVTP